MSIKGMKFLLFYFTGRYRVQYMDLGFTDIVTLPPGTRKINITELSSSRNILGEFENNRIKV